MNNLEEIVRQSNASLEKQDLTNVLNIIKPHEPKVILEIGMWKGFSAEVWIKAFNPDLLITLEHNHKDPTGVYYETNPRYYYLWDSDSNNKATLETVKYILNDRQVDFLFIDGGHEYETVRKDIELYFPLVKEGGIIGFHDILYWADACQVNPHWEKLKKNYDYVEINCGQGSTGFGLIFKNYREFKLTGDLHE